MLDRNSKKIKKKPQIDPQKNGINPLFDEFKHFDFDELAIFHPPLSKYVTFSPKGASVINWKDVNALRELTKAILLYKFKLSFWEIPSKFLCPTIPSRILYLEWISSVIKGMKSEEKFIKGLDIGTGASLIYPLLGYKLFKWHFVASEKNLEAFENAIQIKEKNNLNSFIDIRLSKEGCILKSIIDKNHDFFEFSMCNPPFFESLEEQKTVSWRKSDLQRFEGEFVGGEIEFVRQMFEESKEYKENVRYFTSLFGRKKDYETFLREFEQKKESFELKSTTFQIGKNTRWAIAWRFIL